MDYLYYFVHYFTLFFFILSCLNEIIMYNNLFIPNKGACIWLNQWKNTNGTNSM